MSNYFSDVACLPDLGLGLGLRSQHFNHIIEHEPDVDWFEIISENFMDSGGRPKYMLERIAEQYPIVMHGVSMSIGSSNPLDFSYLKKLKKLANEIKPAWVSDHLCWTGVLGMNTHDLLPVPFTEESLKHISDRLNLVQEYLERPLIIENPSSYLTFAHSTLQEWEFLVELVKNTGCGLLLDVNNVYVSAFNHGFDSKRYIDYIPAESVVQMHIAGHQHCGNHIIDTHDREVDQNVWDLFSYAWKKMGDKSLLLEWDGNIPPFEEYHAELKKAEQYMSTFNNNGEELLVSLDKTVDSSYNSIDFMSNKVSKEVLFEADKKEKSWN
ncbi:MNIO family bufferin maturase [Aureibacter tunicatorum]|uniref:UPF0276 protein HNQ88_002714 n=1 Tax=Aureibacter tunicatorum TaxID=866807 RepID=A0AAE4BSE2_9BACT|nr:DUF692 domain-containing protein [Aureibacter tunicatorum]MDR6239666.1 hypothetical protein [Aureibacter tunicatorum]